MSPEVLKAKIMTLAARPQGMCRQDASKCFGMTVRSEGRALLDKLESTGELFGVFHPQQKHNGKPKTTLFTTAEAAGLWCSKPRPGAPKVKRPDVAKRMTERHASVRAARQPLPVLPPKVSTEAQITGATKITIAPVFVDRRFVPDFVPRVVNANECSAWARAATERAA